MFHFKTTFYSILLAIAFSTNCNAQDSGLAVWKADSLKKADLIKKYRENPLIDIDMIPSDKVERLIKDGLYEKMKEITKNELVKVQPEASTEMIEKNARFLVCKYCSYEVDSCHIPGCDIDYSISHNISNMDKDIYTSISKSIPEFEEKILDHYASWVKIVATGDYDYSYLFQLKSYINSHREHIFSPKTEKMVEKRIKPILTSKDKILDDMYGSPKEDKEKIKDYAFNNTSIYSIAYAKVLYELYHQKISKKALIECIHYDCEQDRETLIIPSTVFNVLISNIKDAYLFKAAKEIKTEEYEYMYSKTYKEMIEWKNSRYSDFHQEGKEYSEYRDKIKIISSLIYKNREELFGDVCEKYKLPQHKKKEFYDFISENCNDFVLYFFHNRYKFESLLPNSFTDKLIEYAQWYTDSKARKDLLSVDKEAMKILEKAKVDDKEHYLAIIDYCKWNAKGYYDSYKRKITPNVPDEDKIVIPENYNSTASYNGDIIAVLQNNLKYPEDARKKGVQGRVLVSFIVDQNGNTRYLRAINTIHPSLAKEALRVTKLLKKWNIGRQYGRPIRTVFTIPITFQLQQSYF